MKTYWMDLETYSECPISHGSHAYAAHPSTRILLWAYAEDDGPVKVWDCDENPVMPSDLAKAIAEIQSMKARHVWHNGINFDTVVLAHQGYRLPLHYCDDVMVMAYQAALPGSLEQLGQVFRLEEDKAKIKDGRRLINWFCSPKLDKHGCKFRVLGTDRPEDWKKFKEYCARDVEAMRQIHKLIPKFNCTEAEKTFQLFDAEVNNRGMAVDLDLARSAIALAKENKDRIDAETKRLTEGAVETATQTAALKDYISKRFKMDLDSLTKGEIEKLANDSTLPEQLRQLLTCRLRGAKTSVAKYQRVVDGTTDGRLRGCLQFRGAARTGRFSGRTFQPQNLPRPSLSNEEIEAAIEAMKAGCLDLFYDDYSGVLSDALRGLIVAPKGSKLCVADYSNVEGRVLAWLAGEPWKLQAFRDFDEGHGHDLYKVTYGRTFGIAPEDVTKKQRQVGKVEELALGYGGGAGAFAQFALLYGIDLDSMSREVKKAADPRIWMDSVGMWEWAVTKGMTAGLSEEQWAACNTVKQAWRNANPHIVKFWDSCETAVRGAIENPGEKFYIRKDMYALRRGSWLVIRLPSGRFLSYPSPDSPEDDNITYYGVNQYTRKWEKLRTYGPKLTENIVQATACDLLLEAGTRLEKAGFKVVLSVHDEYIAEVLDDGKHDYKEMERIMSELPAWAEGLPLVAAGFESYRYRK